MKSRLLSALLCLLLLTGALRIAASEGHVALWQDGVVIRRSATPVRVLPEADQDALARGVWAATEAGAAAILEDLCG